MSSKSKKPSVPTPQECDNLCQVFKVAAKDGGIKLRFAAIAAKTFDNHFGTDYICDIAREIGKTPRFVRDAQFTKSNGTAGRAKDAFAKLADSMNVNEIVKHSKRPSRRGQRPPSAISQARRQKAVLGKQSYV